MNQQTTTESNAKEFAAIDLGSNSFHMIIVRIVNGSIQVLSRLKQRVQLAQGLDDKQQLSREAIERGVACLALFAERLQGFPTENVRAVGTYTLRRAVNNEEFLTAAAQVFPFPIRIISGTEEAKLIYSGVSHTQPENGRKLVVDIGGGSTEMIIGEGFNPLIAESRHMGCVSFGKTYFGDGKISNKNFNQAKQAALSKIEDLSWEYRHLGWQSVLGSSGTIKTVSQIIAENFNNDGVITAENLQQLIERVLKFDSFDKLKIAGLTDDRISVFVPGLAILSAVFENYRIEQMRYSDGALREGVMYGLESSFQVDDIRERTVNSLMEHFNVDQDQALRVADTAVLLGQKYARWRNPDLVADMQNILLSAALLHEVGIAINHSGVQKHSAYILQNSELPGFDRSQQRLLATLTRFQIKSFKLSDLTPQDNRYEVQDILALIILLRLALIINRSRRATELTDKFTLDVSSDLTHWELEFENGYLDRNPLTQSELSDEKTFLSSLNTQLAFK
ncbi:exopolyphosphatase [Testudinibacter sp. TR-2022]|uniref:exopolyphosphatase n=1 Tax=Testudinibacter sp. TR-2022 TaxID=2585029 RepID=UPI00111AD14C|nr:exopolyphosphatase [Testudinibacter sp. TR-2022]TNH05354.1 exopolyphosphatase [Pasteurellaceae bacterium Phil31]TNH11251.1 exopolyphosphatase [Testudinibacter sp. TR-2022]TNH11341.1 exopolyphosphatase [Testudinibacter sp. TR-2022]TNH14366.1 exopolyphosphatase [Testudinibacter sp. TR-2022]TNH20421.1 exopolyphosphatase [Testudinibacter sp. TR-2022]